MATLNIPDGYQQIMPYLILKNAAGFIDFMKHAFGAEEKLREMRNETTIMHAEIKLGNSTIMFADSTDQFSPQNAGLFIYVEDTDDTYKKALAAGATSIQPPVDQTYGRSAGVKDPFGNTLWITAAPR